MIQGGRRAVIRDGQIADAAVADGREVLNLVEGRQFDPAVVVPGERADRAVLQGQRRLVERDPQQRLDRAHQQAAVGYDYGLPCGPLAGCPQRPPLRAGPIGGATRPPGSRSPGRPRAIAEGASAWSRSRSSRNWS